MYDYKSRRSNKTGLPDDLKTGIESLSGYSMDDVRVHRNSSQPADMNAHAFAQGRDIHLAPGQEKHLPHEAWHVVQQKQGRVQATKQLKSTSGLNDDVGLEREADVMGAKAAELGRGGSREQAVTQRMERSGPENTSGIIQRAEGDENDSIKDKAVKAVTDLASGAGTVWSLRGFVLAVRDLYNATNDAQRLAALKALKNTLLSLAKVNNEYAKLVNDILDLLENGFQIYNAPDLAAWTALVAKLMVKLGTFYAIYCGIPPGYARHGRTALELTIDNIGTVRDWTVAGILAAINYTVQGVRGLTGL